MRIQLRLLLPLVVGGSVAVGFIIAAASVGDVVREVLSTVPGVTTDRAVESAVRIVGIAGALVTAVTVLASVLIARMIAGPLSRMRDAAERLAGEEVAAEQDTPLAEIQDVARGIAGAVGELRDRHGREVRERSELARLVEAVSEGILQTDAGGRVTRVNRAAGTLLRLPEDAVGRPVGALFRIPELRELMDEAARGQSTDPAEVVVDDQRVLVSVSPQDDGGTVATFVDLTDLRRLEEVRRDFVANASHELKTPLTSIRGYTETLLSGGLAESEETQFLATIARNAERLQRIVDDLLDLSRLEAGRWQPELAPVDVMKAAESCWLSFADRAVDQGVTFSVESNTDEKGRADRSALEQIFSNLYDNALRYTPEGGRIRVTTHYADTAPVNGAAPHTNRGHRQGADTDPGSAGGGGRGAAGGPWIVAEVADTGAGIPRDAIPRIFERFYRVDPARSRAEGGTGLGLSIVRHMLESMGGGVDARSELGKGTIIRIWLPVAA
ncbi:MAG: sensor histidine kinase [Candidatus Longimicrobiales bacterium M2_2A_002]